MDQSPHGTAKQVLDVVPMVMRDIRTQMRSRAVGLTVPQFRSLSYMERNEGSTLSDLAAHMGLALPSASRLIDGMLGHGLVSREEHPGDRRRIRLAVTRKGRSILEASREETLAYLTGKMKRVNGDDRVAVARAMETLRDAFAQSRNARSSREGR
jgi:DNA-binding MarR family transcriptional regulator